MLRKAAGEMRVERPGVILRLVATLLGLDDFLEDGVQLLRDLYALLLQRASGLALVHGGEHVEDLVHIVGLCLCFVDLGLDVVQRGEIGFVVVTNGVAHS